MRPAVESFRGRLASVRSKSKRVLLGSIDIATVVAIFIPLQLDGILFCISGVYYSEKNMNALYQLSMNIEGPHNIFGHYTNM